MDLGLKDKVAVVTGTGSQIGFGKAIALALAKETGLTQRRLYRDDPPHGDGGRCKVA